MHYQPLYSKVFITPSCQILCDPMDCSLPDSSVHGISPGNDTGVDCHTLLQGIFPTQGQNSHLLCLLHWQAGSLPLALPRHLGKCAEGEATRKIFLLFHISSSIMQISHIHNVATCPHDIINYETMTEEPVRNNIRMFRDFF